MKGKAGQLGAKKRPRKAKIENNFSPDDIVLPRFRAQHVAFDPAIRFPKRIRHQSSDLSTSWGHQSSARWGIVAVVHI
jgi:hypothetical protein